MVEYDMLGNERHKAVCKLREMPKLYPNKDGGADLYAWKRELANAIGADTELFSAIRDRLIHLLGGDQPTLSELFGILREDDDGVDARPSDTASADSLVHGAAGCGCGGACDCDGEELLAPITTELREYMETYRPIEDAGHVVVSRIGTIGFEGFDRLCDSIDAVHAGLERENKELRDALNDTVNQATSAREYWKELHEQLLKDIHGLEHDVEMWRDRAEDMRMERDDALADSMQLPKDADGVQWNVGDRDEYGYEVIELKLTSDGWYIITDDLWPKKPESIRHHYASTDASTVENVLHDFVDAWAEWKDGTAMMNPVETFAAKLKLADA